MRFPPAKGSDWKVWANNLQTELYKLLGAIASPEDLAPRIGTVRLLAGSRLLPSEKVAAGQTLKQLDYPDLYKALGSKYNTGGELANEFRMPDWVAYAPAGSYYVMQVTGVSGKEVVGEPQGTFTGGSSGGPDGVLSIDGGFASTTYGGSFISGGSA
jgi:hypothetical protein